MSLSPLEQCAISFLSRCLADEAIDSIPSEAMETIPLQCVHAAVAALGLARETPVVVSLYQHWISARLANPPDTALEWFNLGMDLRDLGDQSGALSAYQHAAALNPNLQPPHVNLALLHEEAGRFDVAFSAWQGAFQATEHQIRDRNDILEHRTRLRQKMCAWEQLDDEQAVGENMESPWGVLALSDHVPTQTRLNKAWIERKIPSAPLRLSPPEGYDHEKIRVGYLSSDFRVHPMSYLVAQLFETHDRNRFEIFGYCNSQEDGSLIRQQVLASFDHVVSIRGIDDEAAARLIRSHEIDILVDLNGLTLGARLGVLRWKPAPVQMTYLGYIGPVPLPELDYILCDDYVIPPEMVPFYQPLPLSLGRLYQVNDSRSPSAHTLSREACALPPAGFVYCCFSRHHKITKTIFTAWLEILKRTENSVLWLLRDNVWSQANLCTYAAKHGVAPERLIFATYADHSNYLQQFTLADLFLDTTPYNSGTVASDALRMALPLLTLEGKSFASRMAGSLLTSVGLSALIAPDLENYIHMAVELCHNPAKLERARAVLRGGAWQRTLGDITGFTASLENTYRRVVKRPQEDSPSSGNSPS